MRIGVPREIKVHEYRVGLTPDGAREMVDHGHEVIVERGAGHGADCEDAAYEAAGARIAPDAASVFGEAELIVKVKEPQPAEWTRLRRGHTLFAYLHLAPDPAQARGLMESGCIAIAYETVTDAHGELPLLAPMSEVAGRLAVQEGAHALANPQGGRGVLLGGVPGVAPANVVVIGGGVVGYNAARVALGMGARVTIFDRSIARMKTLDEWFEGRVATLYSTASALEAAVRHADLVIGAVLVPGAAAPKLVTRAMLRSMRRGAVVVDVAIDQGGCFETSHPTTHDAPVFVEEGVLHYCVANMPGAVARTSTYALTNATLPFVRALADKGTRPALQQDEHLRHGLNIYEGRVTHPAVAESLGAPYTPAEQALQP